MPQLLELEDGSRWFTLARSVPAQGARVGGVRARFAVALGVAAAEAAGLAAAGGIDLAGPAVPVGLGCRACTRPACPQRSAPPAGRALLLSERETGMSPLTFASD